LGTLTASYAAERLVAGWQYVGAANGMSVWDLLMVGSYVLEPGPVFYYVILGFLVAAYLASRWIVRSQLGLVLAGMRQNEERLAFFGYRVQVFKALLFSFAGMIAGLSGGLYAFHEGFVGPASMGIALSTNAVLYGLFGGVGTLIGPVLGRRGHRGGGVHPVRHRRASRPTGRSSSASSCWWSWPTARAASWACWCRGASASAPSASGADAPREPSAKPEPAVEDGKRHGAA
jgi:hypothetical protein